MTPDLSSLTLEERFGIAYRQLVLIQAAMNVDLDGACMDSADVSEAVMEAARLALVALEPIRHAPGGIANWMPGEKGGRS